MKKITLISIIIATFTTKSFAYCPIPQWCPKADLHQTLWTGEQIDPIEFPSVIGKTLIIDWWTDGTRIHSFGTPPPGISVSGTTTNNREYSSHPIAISGTPTNPGTYHYTVSNTCGVELLHGSITVNATPTGCNFGTPARNLVTITSARFATNQTWPVGDQIWSDAVVSDQCAPRGNSYNGGNDPNFNVDCRNAINGFDGSYFSWCAVMKYATLFCPGDWRVPTTEEFLALHLTLGYAAPATQTGSVSIIADTYMGATGSGPAAVNRGGTWGGSRFTALASHLTTASSHYWSLSENSSSDAFNLHYTSSVVYPQLSTNKNFGFALRCVRDN
ncbi:MAG: hypothetical protein FWG79_03165 [Bacteroidales bacterium]|nr:hypothetical protein [Bacteroidales bacterium]